MNHEDQVIAPVALSRYRIYVLDLVIISCLLFKKSLVDSRMNARLIFSGDLSVLMSSLWAILLCDQIIALSFQAFAPCPPSRRCHFGRSDYCSCVKKSEADFVIFDSTTAPLS